MKFEALVNKSSRAALICKKHSPAILLGVGIEEKINDLKTTLNSFYEKKTEDNNDISEED